jgi:hypothetical protein
MSREYEYPNLMLLDLGPKQVLVIVSIADPADHLDVSLAGPSVSSSSSGHLFFFFSFAGAQYREQQRLPVKFT